MTDAELLEVAQVVATAHGLRPALVWAVILHESSKYPAAFRPEPTYRWLWDVRQDKPFRPLESWEAHLITPPSDFPALPPCSPIAEWQGQRTSWGCMQVMGAVARELGYHEVYLAGLAGDVAAGVTLGCTYLANQLARYGSENDALAAYNAGAVSSPDGQSYAKAVLRLAVPQ